LGLPAASLVAAVAEILDAAAAVPARDLTGRRMTDRRVGYGAAVPPAAVRSPIPAAPILAGIAVGVAAARPAATMRTSSIPADVRSAAIAGLHLAVMMVMRAVMLLRFRRRRGERERGCGCGDREERKQF